MFPRAVVISPSGLVTNENICISVTDGGREDGEGQSCVRKHAEDHRHVREEGQRFQVNADAGIQIRMDSDFTDIQILGGKKSGRPKERKSSLYHIHKFMNFRLSSLLSKVPVPGSV